MNKINANQNGFWTVRKGAEIELVVRKSRFVTYIQHVTSREEAQSFLNSIKAVHRDAVHHCFAYRVGELGMEARMSDDGEPSGTAGKPILFCLQKSSITDVICIVVRYFGGTKLGVGPLARAYAEACSLALNASELEFKKELTNVLIYSSFEDVTKVITLLEEFGLEYAQEFSEIVTFNVFAPTAELDELTTQLIERTSGRSGVSKISA